MKGRTDEEGDNPVADKPADNASVRGELESRDGGKHGTPQVQPMMEQILDRENLAQAWKRVKANKGAPGVDGMTVDAFPTFWREHWERISQALMKGTYRPASVRRVWIPKPDGTMRPLGVPTVLDRLIQQAMAQVLGPLFEGSFSAHSYGFRPGRSAHQAVTELESCWKARRRHAVDCDLKSFFDTVNHDRLMEALRKKVKCPRTLCLIRRYLTVGVVLPDGTREATPQGVPQGGPLSPLLANIVLDPLDKELEARGHKFARYADDFIVMVKSAKAAQRVMASLIHYCEGRLKLVVNRAKSQTAPVQSCAFLGYQVGKRGKLVWTLKALHRFKQRVREITRRNRQGGAGTGQLAAQTGAIVLLEAMETATHATPTFDRSGNRSRPRQAGVAQPKRLLADEPKFHRAHSTQQPMAKRTRRARHPGNMDRTSLRAKRPSLIGTAGYGPVRPVVWDPWLTLVSHGDPISPVGMLDVQ